MMGAKVENRDFKYILQDFGNFYIGARWSYREMLLQEDMPFKWKAIIRHYLLKDVDENTTMENHIFFMKEEDFAYETYRQLKAKFKLSVFNGGDGKKRAKGGYVSREYKIEEIVGNAKLHESMDTVIVEELHLTKLALLSFAV